MLPAQESGHKLSVGTKLNATGVGSFIITLTNALHPSVSVTVAI